MKAIFIAAALAAFQFEAWAEDLSDKEIWNRGVDEYRAGDTTNALATLRGLLLSRTHAGRAGELVGAMEYEAGNLEEAAAAMQIALRAAPDDARVARNFARAAGPLPAAREAARVEAALAAAKGKDPGSLLAGGLAEARALLSGAAGVLTNDAARAVKLSEQFAARADRLSDVWIPVKLAVVESVTNEQDAAAVASAIEDARGKTLGAADELADLLPEAALTLGEVENAFYRFRKMAISPPDAIDEDLLAQTNAFARVQEINGRPWQAEALDFTKIFRAGFPEWARQYEERARADTNLPPFTAEAQAEINALAGEVEKLQLPLADGSRDDDGDRKSALAKLERIRELLPKNGKGGASGQQNQQDRQNQQSQDDRKGEEQDSSPQPDDSQGDSGQDEMQERQDEQDDRCRA